MKRRMSPIWAVVEMNSNAVGLTDVVRRSRTAVSAAGRMGHSSSNPSTLIQAVMSSIASTSVASRASHGVPASRCFTSLRCSARSPSRVSASTVKLDPSDHSRLLVQMQLANLGPPTAADAILGGPYVDYLTSWTYHVPGNTQGEVGRGAVFA